MFNFSSSLRNSLRATFCRVQKKHLSDVKKISVLIQSPQHKDFDDILKFMTKEYFPNEPTCKSLGITNCSILLDKMLMSLAQGVSLIATDKSNGKIIGVALNEITNPWNADQVDEMARSVQNLNLKNLLKFYAHIEKTPDLFQKFKVSEILEISNLSVAANAQKLGIGHELMRRSGDVAANKRIRLIRVDATSAFTAKICEKLGMQKVCEFPYNTYLNAKGEPVFKIPSPHTACKTFIIQLPDTMETPN